MSEDESRKLERLLSLIPEQYRDTFRESAEFMRGMIFGMLFWDQVMVFRRQRADLEHLFVLISFGDLLGVPILPPYYSLRLLPYIVPMVNTWKRRMLRERDLTDLATG
jgi:hypothetical protein